MQSIEITLPMPPSLHQYYGHRNRRIYVTKKGREYKSSVALEVAVSGLLPLYEYSGKGEPKKPAQTAFSQARVGVSVLVVGKGRNWDLDNRMKALLDSMEGWIYDDDAQIDVLHVERASCPRHQEPHVVVNVYQC